MSDETDIEPVQRNAQLAKFEQMPPALMDEIRGDPEASRAYYRTISTTVDHEVYQMRMQLPMAQRLAWAERWAKLGAMEPKKQEVQQAGAQFSIQINIPQIGTTKATGVTIEASPTIEAESVAVELPGKLPVKNAFECLSEAEEGSE
jgi:hypothetical protein